MTLLHLDFETYSTANLGKVGVHNYLTHPSTEVLLTCLALDDEEVQVVEGVHPYLCDYLSDPNVTAVAFNAEFERLVCRYLLDIEVPPERWLCTMALAWHLSFTGGLAEVAKQIGLATEKHDRSGMLKFCQPRNKKTGTRWTADDDPDGWGKFVDYGKQDVVVSREIHRWASRYPWSPREREMWCLDQVINDTGWPVDLHLIKGAVRCYGLELARLKNRLNAHTGLANANSIQQLLPWCQARGYDHENLQAETVTQALEQGANGELRTALELRQQIAKSTPKKWDTLARMSSPDNRIRATLEFGAASRTQRWGGRGFQPQNLFSEREYDIAELATAIELGSAHLADSYGSVMRALSGAIRAGVTAPAGKRLVVCDKSSIESRLLGWFAGEQRINDLFARRADTYIDLASRIFHKPIEQVTKAERTFAKPAELGAGYMLSGKGLVKYAGDMGVPMTEDEASRVIGIWRESNPAVVRMWDWFQAAAFDTVESYNVHEGYRVRFRRDERFFIIDLPSGRSIYYYAPLIKLNDWGRPSLTYMGRDQQRAAWQRVYTHPGKTTENIDQTLARDTLREDLLNAVDIEDCILVGHVHDEAVAEADTDEAERVLAELTRIMATTPVWAPGLVLDAEGFICERYRKG